MECQRDPQSVGHRERLKSSDNQTCTYGYDDVPRITGTNCGSVWSQTFSFDPFGNITKNGSSMFQPLYNNGRNRITSVGSSNASYDNNGNATYDTAHYYGWDADGNSISVDNGAVNITYDALDRAIEQARGTSYTQIVYSPTGAKLALMNGQTLQKAFVSLPGKATAVYTSSGLDHYRHSDWLGSARLTSSPSRTVTSTVAYGPYGETYAQSGTADPSFTGMNSDTVAGDYDFPAREYSVQGRWPSPDRAGLGAVSLTAPQSWNRYAYVLNNPLGLVDPTGMCNTTGDEIGDSDCFDSGSSPVDQPHLIGDWCSDNTSCKGVWQRDASTPSPEGYPTFIPGLPGPPQRIGIPITITFGDGTTLTDTWYGCARPNWHSKRGHQLRNPNRRRSEDNSQVVLRRHETPGFDITVYI